MKGAICWEEEFEEDISFLDISHVITGFIDSPAGSIARIATTLTAKDYWYDCKARWSIKRNHFRIPTGLYAVGNPDENSPVLVSANYKLTFDKLRIELSGMGLWLLVIDTKGVNVWCSAGKGTFSASEIIYQIKAAGLEKVVAHKRLILPQLAAPGVAAHAVTKSTGFKVLYGPIRAKDIPEYIANGYKATADMRKISFTISERIVLTPVELIMGLKYIPIAFIMLLIINMLNKHGTGLGQVVKAAGFNSLAYLIAIIIGAVLVPLMLPLLPFRAFVLKGAAAGIIWSGLVIWLADVFMFRSQLTAMLGNSLLLTALISFLALNFTGSTPYTSFSGTEKETLTAVPILLIASLAGIVLLIISCFAAI